MVQAGPSGAPDRFTSVRTPLMYTLTLPEAAAAAGRGAASVATISGAARPTRTALARRLTVPLPYQRRTPGEPTPPTTEASPYPTRRPGSPEGSAYRACRTRRAPGACT